MFHIGTLKIWNNLASFMTTKIIDFTEIQKDKEEQKKQIVYLHQETGLYDGLYFKDNDPDIAYRIKISFWGVDQQGEIVALIPFLKDICVLEELNDPEKMHFAGYYDVLNEEILEELPEFKEKEVLHYKSNFDLSRKNKDCLNSEIVQTIQDNSGVHGVFVDVNTEELSIVPIHSWRLYDDGTLEPFIVREDAMHLSPIILTGTPEDDNYIESMHVMPNFSYYFNYETAQKVKDSIMNGGQIEMSQDFFDSLTKKD